MEKRNKSAILTLIIGLVLNIALGASKLVAGILSGSTAVSSDAFNNLSDAAVSVVTMLSVFLAARGADHDHPYGHGRYEYIASFVLGAVIAAVGIEVLINGVKRAINPQDVAFDAVVWATLGVSVGVKAFMAVFYRVRSRHGQADVLGAAAVDSMSDAIVTSAVLVCALIERFTGAHIDGYASIGVALFILVLAVRILRRTVSRLLGERPDGALVESVDAIISAAPEVVSSHDLIINDYGADHKIAEVDLVFPSRMTFIDVHAVCDRLERDVMEKTGIKLSIHADPLMEDDARLSDLVRRVEEAISPFGVTCHDVEIDDGARTVKMDIRVERDGEPIDEIKGIASAAVISALDYEAQINIDYN